MVSLTGYMLGEYKAYLLRQKCKILNEMLKFLRAVIDNMKYKQDNVKDVLSKVALQANNNLFNMRFDSESAQDWPQELENVLSVTFKSVSYAVTQAEYLPLRAALTELGHSNINKELRQLQYYFEVINAKYNESCNLLKTQNKLYRALGLSAGIALGVILM